MGIGYGYVEDYEPLRVPPVQRYAIIWSPVRDYETVYFRGCCGCDSAPHPCDGGQVFWLTWEMRVSDLDYLLDHWLEWEYGRRLNLEDFAEACQ